MDVDIFLVFIQIEFNVMTSYTTPYTITKNIHLGWVIAVLTFGSKTTCTAMCCLGMPVLKLRRMSMMKMLSLMQLNTAHELLFSSLKNAIATGRITKFAISNINMMKSQRNLNIHIAFFFYLKFISIQPISTIFSQLLLLIVGLFWLKTCVFSVLFFKQTGIVTRLWCGRF